MRIVFIIFILIQAFLYNISAQSKKEIRNNQIKSKVVWRYDYKTGKEIKIKESEKKYDQNGNIIQENIYDEYGKLDKKIKYTYNEDNDVTKEVHYAGNGKLRKTIRYKYENGLKTEKKVFDSNDKLKSKKIYQYIKGTSKN